MLFFIPTAIVALANHIKNKNVDFKTGVPILLLGLGGAVIGSNIALSMDGSILRKVFGVFLLAMGVYELFGKTRAKRDIKKERKH